MKRGIAVMMLLFAAACSGGLRSNAPPAQTYFLRALAPQVPSMVAAKPAAGTLRVARPLPAPGLGSDHIVIVQPDHRMSYYAASQWPEELPRVVEALAVERLRATGDWAAVTGSDSAISSEYFLQIAIRRFEAEYTSESAPPTAQVAFDCAFGRRGDQMLLASFSAQGAAVASANRVGAVVAAFEEAANAALSEVTAHSIAAVRNSQVPSNP
jgi:cholesterol transport system auxiliary component